MTRRDPGLETCEVQCPYCGEALALVVDASAGAQRYVEDCAVCCRPMDVVVVVVDGDVHVVARHEDEA